MTLLAQSPVIDPARWPGVASVPNAPIKAAIARQLFRGIAARLRLRIVRPGEAAGNGPTMVLRRPDAFFARLGKNGLIGFGESYQAGDWDSDDLVGLLTVMAREMSTLVPPKLQWLRRFYSARTPQVERNTLEGSRSNISRHYDLSNDLFALFLDGTMSYSSAIFGNGDRSLEESQHRKIDRLLDEAGVTNGTKLLEIGTGWGELAIRAAQRGAKVTSVTLSAEQRTLALQRAKAAGVEISVELTDYREIKPIDGGYNAIVSVEMIEAVGEAFWQTYAATLEKHLAPGGRVALQMITMAHDRLQATKDSYTWIHKYVFPGGLIPSVRAIDTVARRAGLRITERLDFGLDYAETLRRWRATFLARRDEAAALGFDATFARTWDFYLAYCEAGFASHYLDVCQLTLERAR